MHSIHYTADRCSTAFFLCRCRCVYTIVKYYVHTKRNPFFEKSLWIRWYTRTGITTFFYILLGTYEIFTIYTEYLLQGNIRVLDRLFKWIHNQWNTKKNVVNSLLYLYIDFLIWQFIVKNEKKCVPCVGTNKFLEIVLYI